jgi:hypothetical protein
VTTPIIRTSERRDFKRCPWRWWQAWRKGLVPVGSVSDALWFGTGVHIALASHYCGPGLKRGPHPAVTFGKWATAEMRFIKTSDKFGNGARATIEEKLVPALELGTTLLEEYIRTYGPDDSWWVIAPEQSGQVSVPDPTDPQQVLAIYGFTYDLVFRDLIDEQIWLGEHKTAKAIMLDHLPLDDQAGSYWAVAGPQLQADGLLGKREKIAGIMYNFLKKSLPDTRPRNAQGMYTNQPGKADYIEVLKDVVAGHSAPSLGKLKLESLAEIARGYGIQVFGEVSKLQPKPLFVREAVFRTARERGSQIDHIQTEALHMRAFREGTLPLYKNPTKDCQWDCSFYNLCLLDEGGGDARQYQRAMYSVADPYASHRKSTEE